MEQTLGSIVGPVYLVLGLSLLIYPNQWLKLVRAFASNHFELLSLSLLNLIIGLILVNTYNVWEYNIFVVITLTGWIALIKGVFYFLAPGTWIKKLIKVTSNSGSIITSGAVATIVGAALSYYSLLV